ncbi:epsin-3-like isoform X2 [Xyrauchen texanus]|uniref:epsin-3-like isoform X2 n=1 Tax=Xyrauchen texanus TaxID=154827 RepID=UPI002242408A|nr:epsin-3-like isoform X2 [Xyrauchen texanus]
MTTSSLRRQVKNIVNNYTDAEIKVREATSNDSCGPPTSLMMEIADLTFNVLSLTEVMGIIWKRLNDHGKNWRHVYKALNLLDYLIKTGSEQVAKQCKENIYNIQTLRDFQYIDRDGKDQGTNVREKSKQLVSLLRDDERIKQERSLAQKTRERMAGTSSAMGYGSLPPPYPGRRSSQPSMAALYGEEYGRSRGSPSSFNFSSSSPHLAPDLERARPQTSGEEDLQLQLALAMSREESEKPPPSALAPVPAPVLDIDEQTQLRIAMNLSKELAQKPVPPPAAALDMDEDAQLQLALNLSKEEHQQEERSRQGDESLLQKALEESKREMEAKGGGSASLDLVEIFAPAPDLPSSVHPWDSSGGHSAIAQGGHLRSDPWDSLEPGSSSQRSDSSWMAPPAASIRSQPWSQRLPAPDPWEAPHNTPSHVSMNQSWMSPAHTVNRQGSIGPLKTPSPRAGSPSDDDLFDEAMDGGQANVNDHVSPGIFDMSSFGNNLPKSAPRTYSNPEAFLGPTAASLVNLVSLIPSNPPAKNFNPFLSGETAPSAANPFQHEQPRLTLNQMRPSSTSPVPTSLPFSGTQSMLTSNQPSSLPNTFTQSAQAQLEIHRDLPQPLLPLSTTSTFGDPDQHNQNPFL